MAKAERSDPEGDQSRPPWQRTRRVLAAVLLVGAAALVIASHYSAALDVCTPLEASSGQKQECGSFALTDVLPVLLVALILLLPDFNSFEIAGLVKVVRRLDEGQHRLEHGQDRLERQLTQVQVSTQNLYAPNIHIENRLASEARASEQQHPELVRSAQREESDVGSRFERSWEALKPWSDLARRLNDPTFRGMLQPPEDPMAWRDVAALSPGDRILVAAVPFGDAATMDSIESWAGKARDRLELVRGIRVAGEGATESALVNASIVAEALLGELKAEKLSA